MPSLSPSGSATTRKALKTKDGVSQRIRLKTIFFEDEILPVRQAPGSVISQYSNRATADIHTSWNVDH